MIDKKIQQHLKEFFCVVASVLMRSAKISFIVGSKAAFFSLGQCASPLIGFFGGPLSALLVYATRTGAEGYFSGLGLLTTSLYHIPTLFAALYLSSNSKTVRALLPLVCIVLFITHPTGSQAWLYAAYWLIPLTTAFIPTNSIFLRSLGSTFVAHAVGSVVWLFTHNLDAASWSALSSVVWAERLMFALSMTLMYYAVSYATAYTQQLVPQVKRLLVFNSLKANL